MAQKSKKMKGKQPAKSKKKRVVPKQNYDASIRNMITGIGATAGALAGGYAGGPGGAMLGSQIGALSGRGISHITGHGTYRIQNNIFAAGQSAPRIYNKISNKDKIVVRHCEFLGDIVTSSVAGAFKNQVFPINPALEKTFPMLAQIAANFEEYSFSGLLFEFKSLSADALNSVNTALGAVIMATNYNVLNPPFESKAEMDAYEFSSSDRPSITSIHLVECAPSLNVLTDLYCRPGESAPGDLRFYDLGNFQIATAGMQGTNVTVGELWVSYEVVLLKPKIFSALGSFNSFAHSAAKSGITGANPLGVQVLSEGSNLSFTADGNIITFPISPFPQTYMVMCTWAGINTAMVIPTTTLAGGATGVALAAKDILPSGTNSRWSCATAQTSATLDFQTYLLIPANTANATLTFGGAGTVPLTSCDIKLIQIGNAVY